MDDIIRTENISKHYGDLKAVSELSLNVRKGEIYGFLGLNGAGKTTTIRMLLGMISPTSGSAFINGKKVYADKHDLWKNVGSLVEVPYSYPNLTVRENLEIIRRLRFLKEKESIDNIIEKLRLGPYSDKIARTLSLGNAQRLGLAKALIHNPDILILDEPTNGLDPAGIYEIREMLTTMAAKLGVTIFISSHILGEVSRFSTRIGIIHEGSLVREVSTGELQKLFRRRLLIDSNDRTLARTILKQKSFNLHESEDGLIEIYDNGAIEDPGTIASLMVASGCPPTLLRVAEEDLESFFLRTIGLSREEK